MKACLWSLTYQVGVVIQKAPLSLGKTRVVEVELGLEHFLSLLQASQGEQEGGGATPFCATPRGTESESFTLGVAAR